MGLMIEGLLEVKMLFMYFFFSPTEVGVGGGGGGGLRGWCFFCGRSV